MAMTEKEIEALEREEKAEKAEKEEVVEKEVPKTPEETIAELQAEVARLKQQGEAKATQKKVDELKKAAQVFTEQAERERPKELEKVEEIEEIKTRKVFVGVDFSDEMVLSYYKKGYEIYFEADIGRFKALKPETVDALDRLTRARYTDAFYLNKQNIDSINQPRATQGLEVLGQLASATARLRIDNPKPGRHYAWSSPAEVRDRVYEGYKICEDPDIITLQSDVSGVHRIGALGQTEQVLMETSKEVSDARRKKIEELSKVRIEGALSQGIDRLRAGGHKPFNPQEEENPQRHRFTKVGSLSS
jgi:hypothetical protein